MATGATGQLGLALPVQGELSGTWGDTVNNGITQYTNIAIAATLTLTGDGAVTLANTTGDASASNITSTLAGAGTVTAQFAIVRITGTTTTKVITGPSYSKTYLVDNASSFAVTFKASGQTGVSIAAGEEAIVFFNGTDYVKAASSVVSALTGTLPVANGGTGQTSYTDGQLLIGNTTGNTLTKTTLTAGSNITITNGSGAITIAASGGSAAGSTTQVQYNNAGAFAGSANFTFDGNNISVLSRTFGRGAATTGGANNVAGGQNALASNTTGEFSAAFGYNALTAQTTGDSNTAVGNAALAAVVSGTANTGVGRNAFGNTTASNNTGLGYFAGLNTTTGSENTAVGKQAMETNTTGAQNTAMGYRALYTSNSSAQNVAIGYEALNGTTTGTSGVAVGFQAGYSRTTVSGITAIGYQAGYSDVNPYGGNDANTYLGYKAGYNNTTLNAQTYIGTGAGFTKSGTGGLCTLVGNSAGYYLTTGTGNTCLGYGTMINATTIAYSVAIGDRCMGVGVATGQYNVGVGQVALNALTSGSENVAVGMQSLSLNTTGSSNTAVGMSALYSNTGSTNSTAVGKNALFVATGEHNTAVGALCLNVCTTGSYNTAIGYGAGSSGTTTGSNNTYVGYGSVPSGNATHEIVIGTLGATGKGATTGFISPNGGGVYQGNNSANWSTTSDRRLKKNIVDNNTGLEKLTQIQVRNFEYRVADEVTELPLNQVIQKTGVQLGVIAQELQAVLPECVKTESTGVMTVNSDNLTWYMINAIKELKAEVDSLKSQLNQGA